MKVHNLLQFLRTLEEPLRASGGNRAANELSDACDRLQSFGDFPVAQFAEFLQVADHYARTGEVPVSPSKAASKGKAVDTEKIRSAAQVVNDLYDRATNTDLNYSDIERELNRLSKQLSKDEAVALAAEVDITKPQKTKKAAFEAIQARVFDRKQSFERTRF